MESCFIFSNGSLHVVVVVLRMGSSLFKVATIRLSLPCTTAAVEGGNKAYSPQKTKKRYRLTDERSATLTNIFYNLTLNTDTNQPGTGRQ
jgi:hypothetical protein